MIFARSQLKKWFAGVFCQFCVLEEVALVAHIKTLFNQFLVSIKNKYLFRFFCWPNSNIKNLLHMMNNKKKKVGGEKHLIYAISSICLF